MILAWACPFNINETDSSHIRQNAKWFSVNGILSDGNNCIAFVIFLEDSLIFKVSPPHMPVSLKHIDFTIFCSINHIV